MVASPPDLLIRTNTVSPKFWKWKRYVLKLDMIIVINQNLKFIKKLTLPQVIFDSIILFQ